MISTGSRFLARTAPMASFIARTAPSVVNTVGALASNPLLNAAAQRVGINPNVMRNIATGASNIGAGMSLIPGVVNDARAATNSALSATAPARQSMATLYRTLNPA